MTADEREFEYGQCEATAKSTGEQCGNPAIGEHGKCRFHGGASTGPPKGSKNAKGNPGGAPPEGNGNAEKHGLHADPHKYHERRDQEEKEWIFDVSAAIEDRIRERRGDVDKLDRVLARRCAIKLHIASRATEHVDKDGLMQVIEVQDNGAEYEKEVPHALLSELRSYDRETFSELKKIAGFGDDSEVGGIVAVKEAWIESAE